MSKLQGQESMAGKFRRAVTKFPDAVMAAVYVDTELDVTEVKRRTPVWNSDVPVPKGHTPGSLRASVHQEGPIREGRKISTMIVAGGETAPYAIWVHEDTEAHHKVGEAKFVESVITESAPSKLARVAARLNMQQVFS